MNVISHKPWGDRSTKDVLECDEFRPAGIGDGVGEGGGEGVGVLDHVYILMQIVFDVMCGDVTAILEESRKGSN